MEINRGGSRLKQRLARVFQSPPFLFRSSCNPSTSINTATATNLSSTASSRALLHDAAPAVGEPAVLFSNSKQPRPDEDINDSFFRLLSLAPPNDDDNSHRHRRRAFDLTGGCRPTRSTQLPSVIAKNSKWKSSKTRKKQRRIRETGGYYETGGDGDGWTCPPSSPSKSTTPFYDHWFDNGAPEDEQDEAKKLAERKPKKKKKKLASNAYGFTSSSSMEQISDDELGFFSTEEEEEEEDGSKEEETETFFSSKSFSSEYSSEFYQNPNKKKKKKKKKIKSKKSTKIISEKWGVCKEFQPLVSVTSSSSSEKMNIMKKEEDQEMAKKGFVVKKKSSDPYSDFRSSMVEMIIERQIFGAGDLESLLESYLSLNSPRHHPVILQAFSDIWVVLFDR